MTFGPGGAAPFGSCEPPAGPKAWKWRNLGAVQDARAKGASPCLLIAIASSSWPDLRQLPLLGPAAGIARGRPGGGGEQGTRRISLLTEAVAYVGAVLLLAGGIAASASGGTGSGLGAHGRPRWRRRDLPRDRLLPAPGWRARDPAAGRGGVVPFRGLRWPGLSGSRRTTLREHRRGHGPGRRRRWHRVRGGAVAAARARPQRRPVRRAGHRHLRHHRDQRGRPRTRLPRLPTRSRCGGSASAGRGSGGNGTSSRSG